MSPYSVNWTIVPSLTVNECTQLNCCVFPVVLRRAVSEPMTMTRSPWVMNSFGLEVENLEGLVEDPEELANRLAAAAGAGGREIRRTRGSQVDVFSEQVEERVDVAATKGVVCHPDHTKVVLFAHGTSW